MKTPANLYITMILFIILSLTTSSYCATVSITPSGDSAFTIDGSAMDGVAGIQLEIYYDAKSLNTPTVTQGPLVTGALFAANTSKAGTIKIAIINTNPFSGSGQIATLSFASRTGNGGIISVTRNMIDSKGATVADTVEAQTNEQNSSTSSGAIQNSSNNQASSTVTAPQSATTTNNGTTTLPADLPQRTEVQPTGEAYTQASKPRAAEQSVPSTAIKDVKAEETMQIIVYKGIKERFNTYRGSKTFAAMRALFDRKITQSIRQDPAVLISDGKNKAAIILDLPARISATPGFTVIGGALVSFKQEKEKKGRWLIEVIPSNGSTRTVLTILAGAEEFNYPMTVAPAVEMPLSCDEQGWSSFLKEVLTETKPLHDFNNDGIRDSVDEFIFVANCLAAKKIVTERAAPVNKNRR